MKSRFAKQSRIIIGCLCLVIGLGSWIGMLSIAYAQNQTNQDYFDSIGIKIESIRIPISEGVSYSVFRIHSVTMNMSSNGTVPTVLHLNGVNNRKESRLEHVVGLVQMGFEVFVLEPRGHGQTEARNTFFALEPTDISKMIDYIDGKYPEVNSTHIAASGFSFGSAILLLAQAIEPRIYCSVLYHPPLNIGDIISPYGIVDLFGQKFFLHAPYSPVDTPIFEDRSAWNVCNETNTQNLLLIQGNQDGIINSTRTTQFFAQINPTFPTRNDIQLIIRPGLDHIPNEFDSTSRKYMMAWFGHYYFNASIDLNQLGTEIQYQIPFSLNLNTQEGTLRQLYEIGVIFTEIAMIIFVLMPDWIQAIKQKMRVKKTGIQETNASAYSTDQIKSLLLLNSVVICAVAIVSGVLMKLYDQNVLIGCLYVVPWLSVCFFSIMHKKWKVKQNIPFSTKSKFEFYSGLKIAVAIISPLYLGIGLYDLSALLSLNAPIWPWKGELFALFVLFLGLFYFTHICTANISMKVWWYWLSLIGIISLSIGLYTLWNPIPQIALIPNLPVILIFGLGVLTIILAVLGKFLEKLVKKLWIGVLLITSIAGPLILDRFLNFLL